MNRTHTTQRGLVVMTDHAVDCSSQAAAVPASRSGVIGQHAAV